MGYTTDFTGRFSLDKGLAYDHKKYLKQFSETRRMKRNPAIIPTLPNYEKHSKTLTGLGLGLGTDGEYWAWGGGFAGQDSDASIIDFNNSPDTQPGLWCQWVPTRDGKGIEWNGGEKFYYYIEWLEYIIKNFLHPWGYKLNGEVTWQGEDTDDIGVIVVTDNNIKTYHPEEYLVANTEFHQLPLLINKVTTKKGQAALEARLKGDSNG